MTDTSNFQDRDCREMLETALALAAKGIAVFPLNHGTKKPAKGSRGFYDATTNPATINRWFGGNFKRNLGARTGLVSGVWVFDADDLDALRALEARHGGLPVTLQSQSGRGLHFWFKTAILPVPNSNGRICTGIDTRGEGGYVVVPPSVHPSGARYRWVNDAPIAEPPSWLLMLARKPPPPKTPPPLSGAPRAPFGLPSLYGSAALRAEIQILANTPPGDRNNQLNKSAFALHQLVASGDLVAADVEAALINAAVANGLAVDDGMRQCLATIRSGAKAGLLHPRSRNGGAR
jgi:hypothetical protein